MIHSSPTCPQSEFDMDLTSVDRLILPVIIMFLVFIQKCIYICRLGTETTEVFPARHEPCALLQANSMQIKSVAVIWYMVYLLVVEYQEVISVTKCHADADANDNAKC